MSNSNTDTIIKNRRTQCVLAPPESPWTCQGKLGDFKPTIEALLDLAAAAPYHKPCAQQHQQTLTSSVPWRFYVLDAMNCRWLLDYIKKENIPSGKIANMLAAADALFLVTWLPDPTESITEENDLSEVLPFEGTLKNMEHIAAASAAIQNVLIGATARNIPNYWSTGGQLRKPRLRQHLQIPLSEILLGAIFLFPADSEDRSEKIKLGKMREKGKEKATWSKWVQLQSPSAIVCE
ncbi:MAG: nitroreductase family protein [Bacteroidota bacterium]